MEEVDKTSYVPFPRYVFHDNQEGKLKLNALILYMYIRYSANKYGIAAVNLDKLVIDFRSHKWGRNYINKLLLTLNEQRYIHYDKRAGRKGNFEMRFPNFYVDKGKLTKLPELEEKKIDKVEYVSGQAKAEVTQSLPHFSQRLEDIKASKKALIYKVSSSDGRGEYNDTDNNKVSESTPLKRKTSINSFQPTSYEEQICKEVAILIGEEKMDFLLGTLKKHGFNVIEESLNKYKRLNLSNIENTAAYFNKIVSEQLQIKNRSP